jgi:hypothetical protein
MSVEYKPEFYFHEDNTHPSGIGLITVKITGLDDVQLARLKKYVKRLVYESRRRRGERHD